MMKLIAPLMFAAATVICLGFSGTSASACLAKQVARGDPCAPIALPDTTTRGNIKMALKQEAVLCHPNWGNLQLYQGQRRFSYAIFTTGQLDQLVAALRKSGVWREEVTLKPGQACRTQSFKDNWRFAVFDPCVIKGHNVLRIAKPRAGARLDSPEDWPIVVGKDGKPILFAL